MGSVDSLYSVTTEASFIVKILCLNGLKCVSMTSSLHFRFLFLLTFFIAIMSHFS